MNERLTVILLLFFLLPGLYVQCTELPKLTLNEVFEIGNGPVVLSGKILLTEDLQGRVYILDRQRHRVYKFTPDGKLIKSFGRKGKGPGDFDRPMDIAVSETGRLIICDAFSVSVYDLEGNCLQKHNVMSAGVLFGKKYAGHDKIFAEKRVSRNGAPPLILVSFSPEVKQVGGYVLTCTSQELYKEAGVFHESVTPDIWYTYSHGRSAAALSESYEIYLYDKNGAVEKTIKKHIKNPPLTQKERQFIIDALITPWREVDQTMKNGLKKTIPPVKNLIAGILLSKSKLFVCRVRDDISVPESQIPVDVYLLTGELLGQIRLESFPLHATENHFYFKKETDDGDILVSKYRYMIYFKE